MTRLDRIKMLELHFIPPIVKEFQELNEIRFPYFWKTDHVYLEQLPSLYAVTLGNQVICLSKGIHGSSVVIGETRSLDKDAKRLSPGDFTLKFG